MLTPPFVEGSPPSPSPLVEGNPPSYCEGFTFTPCPFLTEGTTPFKFNPISPSPMVEGNPLLMRDLPFLK